MAKSKAASRHWTRNPAAATSPATGAPPGNLLGGADDIVAHFLERTRWAETGAGRDHRRAHHRRGE